MSTYKRTIIILVYFRTNWVKTDGIIYKCGTGVILNVDDDFPLVGWVNDIDIVRVAFSIKRFFTTYEPQFTCIFAP